MTSFFDAGVAWFGLGPNQEENPLNTVLVSTPPDNPNITIEARYFRDPTVYGYGVGLRSTMLGYFVKFDYGWGVELSLIHISEPTRQAEISYAVFCLK